MYRDGALILAAGKGTRMCSKLPKVVHPLLGESMIVHVAEALKPFFKDAIWTVVGHGADKVRLALSSQQVDFVDQPEQRGTGQALMCALPQLKAAGIERVLIINGDTPLITPRIIQNFIRDAQGTDLAFATLTLHDSAAFGRVIRHNGSVAAIIEAKDYDEAMHGKHDGEINAGLYLLNLKTIEPLLPKLTTSNKSGEYYLTDLVALAVGSKLIVSGLDCGNNPWLLGVNTPLELARSEEIMRAAIVHDYLEKGVSIHLPEQVVIGARVKIAPGAQIYGPCHILGQSVIESEAIISAYCHIQDSYIGAATVVREFCHLEKAKVEAKCTLGPYARLRPEAHMEEEAHVGNFVEMKKTRLGKGSKANHLSYLGDAEIGAGANIGAGTITCNYDGINKHKTIIEDGAFIGSNTSLVAPVRIGTRAVTGAGSAISKDVAADHLGVTRAVQKNILWKK